MAEKNKLKLNPYKDRTTQEGEFGFFSPGTDRGWKLVKDDKDPRKRVWHLVDKDGRVLDKKKGALTIGGNLSEWAQGGIRNTANWFANLSIQQQIKAKEMVDKGYTFKPTSRGGKWVKDKKIDSVSNVSESNNFDQTNQSVDTGSSVDGQTSEIDGVEVQNLSLKTKLRLTQIIIVFLKLLINYKLQVVQNLVEYLQNRNLGLDNGLVVMVQHLKKLIQRL